MKHKRFTAYLATKDFLEMQKLMFNIVEYLYLNVN